MNIFEIKTTVREIHFRQKTIADSRSKYLWKSMIPYIISYSKDTSTNFWWRSSKQWWGPAYVSGNISS